MRTFQPAPAMPVPLLVAAPMMPAVCVPCQELELTLQPLNRLFVRSALVTQSPGSCASASRTLPSLATVASLTMS